jgi:hypothetical protein
MGDSSAQTLRVARIRWVRDSLTVPAVLPVYVMAKEAIQRETEESLRVAPLVSRTGTRVGPPFRAITGSVRIKLQRQIWCCMSCGQAHLPGTVCISS